MADVTAVAKDVVRIIRQRRPGLARGYLSAGFGRARDGRGSTVSLFGMRVDYLDVASMFKLYRDTFVRRIYDVALPPEPVILDCGSNIGMTVVAFKLRYPKARITAFEPNPAAFDVLRRNVKQNGLADVTLHRKALGCQRGTLDIFMSDERPGALNTGVHAPSDWQRTRVESTVLSEYVDGPVDLLKLDVEGAESSVLHELAEAGKLAHIRSLVCEYHHHLPRGDQRLGGTLALLEAHGFVYQIGGYCDSPPFDYRCQSDLLIYARRSQRRRCRPHSVGRIRFRVPLQLPRHGRGGG
jgi:FkbM family methyltransferase